MTVFQICTICKKWGKNHSKRVAVCKATSQHSRIQIEDRVPSEKNRYDGGLLRYLNNKKAWRSEAMTFQYHQAFLGLNLDESTSPQQSGHLRSGGNEYEY